MAKKKSIQKRWKELADRQESARELYRKARTIEAEVREERKSLARESLGLEVGETIVLVSGLKHEEVDHPCLVVGVEYFVTPECWDDVKAFVWPVVRRMNRDKSWSRKRTSLHPSNGTSWRHDERE